jgi:hypothetical protein
VPSHDLPTCLQQALASHTMALVARLKGMGEGPAEPYLATHAALTGRQLL